LGEARKLDVSIDLQKIYYQPSGYQRTIKKLYEASLKAGFDFTLDEVEDWLNSQLLYLVHKARPNNIPKVSFNTITIPNEVHQADVLYTCHVKSGQIIYLFYLNIVDVASRYKVTIPIGARSVKDKQGILTSSTIARCLVNIYDDPDCPLVWPKVFLSDKGSEFKGECEKLLRKHGVKIQKAKSKATMGIVERYNKTFTERFYRILDGNDLLITFPRSLDSIQYESLETLIKDLPNVIATIVEDLNNTITRLLGMSPAEAIKKERVIAKASNPRKGPMGFDETPIPHNAFVLYLLNLSDLEGRRRAGDMNWSPRIYQIRESLIQKNQPILYWLVDNEGNGPERSFVAEELQVIPPDVEYPPQWILSNLSQNCP
jgi:hypothetical protein